tara:strand:- start:11015 stop:11992 length:978 start_codon:yes stop_codon:yes gene_type:complete
MAKILITGGTGFIGAHLTDKLISKGHKVLVVDTLKSLGGIHHINKKGKFIKGDIKENSVIKKVKKWGPNIIYHLAAQSAGESAYDDPKSDLLTNAYGTYLLAELAKKIKVKLFIYASTVAIYGSNKNLITEDTKIQPDSIYGVSKFTGEMYVKQLLENSSTKYINFRIFNTYGPGENLNFLKKGIVSIYSSYVWRNKPITVKGSLYRFRDLTYIEDCINILVKAISIKLKKNQTFNLSSGKTYLVKNIIKTILKVNNLKNYKILVKKGTPGDSFGFHTSNEKLKRTFKYKRFFSLEEGLQRYFKWIKSLPKSRIIKKHHPLNKKY